MDNINEIIKNRIDDGKYTENDILNLATKIYGFIKEEPTALRLIIRFWRLDRTVKYCVNIDELVSAGDQVEAIRYIVEAMVKNLDGLDDIYLYQPVRFAATFDVDFLELRVLIEWSCYNGKEEDNGRATDI